MMKINFKFQKNWASFLTPIILSLLLSTVHSTSNASWIRDYISDSCEKDNSIQIDLVKNILGIFYILKDQNKSGLITEIQYKKRWKEEADQFLDFLHEQTISLDNKFWIKENSETRKVMKLAWEMRSAAILHTAAEFFERDSMPPDSRITRIFIQKCVGIASGSNK